MIEKRGYHRVQCSATAMLVYHQIIYDVRLENLSLKGALISSGECIMVPQGESCRVVIPIDEEGAPIVVTAEVVYAFFSMVGVRFSSFNEDGESRILQLMERITDQPEKLKAEWEEILSQRGSYLGS